MDSRQVYRRGWVSKGPTGRTYYEVKYYYADTGEPVCGAGRETPVDAMAAAAEHLPPAVVVVGELEWREASPGEGKGSG